MEVQSPSGASFPPTPEGKARARRLWDEHEAKTQTGGKAERELTEEQLREHEKILRGERETFELEREREHEERDQQMREQWRDENIEIEKRERDREIQELRERERIRLIEADGMSYIGCCREKKSPSSNHAGHICLHAIAVEHSTMSIAMRLGLLFADCLSATFVGSNDRPISLSCLSA